MCAQCNSKKNHIHTTKAAVGSASTVKVESAVTTDCCSTGTSSSCSSTSDTSDGDDGGDAASSGAVINQPLADKSMTKFKAFTTVENADSSSVLTPPSGSTQPHCHDTPISHNAAGSSNASDCCSAGQCSANEDVLKDENIEAALVNESGHTQRWNILGMDCPSCAAKLEKAVLSLTGVEQAKVMFATEKLVVSSASPMADKIEGKAKEAGFRLVGSTSSVKDDQPSFIQQHFAVIAIAFMMIVSFAIDSQSEFYGLIAFSVTTILGLIPILKKSINLAKSGSPFSIETLMSIAALGALYLGETAEAAMVLLLFLLGEQLEGYAASRARSGVKALMDLVPEEATVVRPNGERTKVAVESLKKGDVIEVAPGARLPADGIVLDIAASFDESALTGESVPVERMPGDKVMAGSLVADKVVQLTIESEQGDNAIDRILHLIEDAESRKAPLERFLDKFSRWYTPAMIVLAALVIVIPPMLFGQSWDEWLYKGLTLLLIACPCAW